MHVKSYLINITIAIAKARRIIVYSIRYDRNGNLVNGKPCSHCVKFLLNFGITRTVYSTKEGNLVASKLTDLDTTLSSGNKY